MARDYGRICTRFWSSPDIRGLSDRGRLLASYLLTSPHSNSIGAYLLPDAYVADDLGWSSEAVSKAFAELLEKGFAERFADGRHICVIRFLDFNPIENPNVGKAAIKAIEQLPDDPAMRHVFKGLERYAKQFGNSLETARERFRNIEPNLAKPILPLPAKAGRAPDDDPEFEDFWKAYNPPPNSKKPDTRKAWASTAELRPPLADLLRAVTAYHAWLASEGRKQKREYPKQHPATWLRGEVWNGFIENAGAAVDEIASKATWDGQAAALVDDLGATVFDAWFKDSRLLLGPPAVIEVSKPFQRNWIANNFAGQIKKHFGEFEVRVAA